MHLCLYRCPHQFEAETRFRQIQSRSHTTPHPLHFVMRGLNPFCGIGRVCSFFLSFLSYLRNFFRSGLLFCEGFNHWLETSSALNKSRKTAKQRTRPCKQKCLPCRIAKRGIKAKGRLYTLQSLKALRENSPSFPLVYEVADFFCNFHIVCLCFL